jgi:hypothetical protein
MLENAGVEMRPLVGEGGLGTIGQASRTKRVYAAPGEESVPYLRPYDVFDYIPEPADQLSRSGSKGLDRLTPEPGTILQTCSGRNLGPLAYADDFISRFVVSDDMIRLQIPKEDERLYALAFLSTPTGQSLLTRSKTGGVIDHLSADDLAAMQIPFMEPKLTQQVVNDMRSALFLRQQARITLAGLTSDYEASLPSPRRDSPLRSGWTHRAAALAGRLDAAFHDPLVLEVRKALKTVGGVRVGDVAQSYIPGRYKRYYVAPEHGRPIVSGRQLLQSRPVNLRYIAPRSFDYAVYELEQGMIAFGAEGRAEERISRPALITSDRADWLANNHVMRIRPRSGVNAGWLYLAFAAWQTQAQVKACSCGSVVDAVSPVDLDEVLLPPADVNKGNEALRCWEDLAAANKREARAIATVEAAIQERASDE